MESIFGSQLPHSPASWYSFNTPLHIHPSPLAHRERSSSCLLFWDPGSYKGQRGHPSSQPASGSPLQCPHHLAIQHLLKLHDGNSMPPNIASSAQD